MLISNDLFFSFYPHVSSIIDVNIKNVHFIFKFSVLNLNTFKKYFKHDHGIKTFKRHLSKYLFDVRNSINIHNLQ